MNEQIRSNKQMMHLIEKVVEEFRRISIMRKELAVKRAEIQRIEAALAEKQAEQQKDLMSSALLIINLRDNRDEFPNLDDLFIEGNEGNVQQARQTVTEAVRMLKFIYCVDPVSELPQDLRAEVMERTRDLQAH